MARIEEIEEKELSAKVQKAVDEIKSQFTGFVRSFEALEAKRGDLAPKFMKAANMWQAETGGTFIDFVRFLVPEVGETVKEYKAHRAYQAADYLRRKAAGPRNLGGDVTQGAGGNAGPGTTQETPMVVLERLLASLLPSIPEKAQEQIYAALKESSNWTDNRIETLRTRVDEVDPLVEIKGRSLDRITFKAVIHEQESAAA